MKETRNLWKNRIYETLEKLARARDVELPGIESIIVETPPKAEMGDIGFPMFGFSKLFKLAPAMIANELVLLLKEESGESVKAVGPYLNVFLPREVLLKRAVEAGPQYGQNDSMAGTKIMIEFSSPNTNKPLHLGHLRNDVLGESVSRILRANSADVQKINLVNDRGVHICKSMLSYMKYGEGRTPESENIKSDHFVGEYYVLFNRLKEENPRAEEEAQNLLLKWEEGDAEILELWKRMNEWAIEGIKKTYERTNVSFDRYYFESQIYQTGKEEVLKGLEKRAFFRAEDGSVRIDLAPIGLDEKVLLRKDGTSIYMTQDIGLAIHRHNDWPFDRLIYVVANEQQYHFKVLFFILASLGYEWARNLYHLSYGLVNLPEGRMKTREGTVVDADTLLDSLRDEALEEMRKKGREESAGDVEAIAEKVALGAVHYYLIQATPGKDMIFNPADSLSFTGNTGPYIQYMGARISSMLRKHSAGEGNAKGGQVKPELLLEDSDWELASLILQYPGVVELAGRDYNPALIAGHIYELANAFSRYYHDKPILSCPEQDLARTRLALAESVLKVLKNGMELLCIPFLEAM